MGVQKINLVKETISELINLMDDKDKLAIIKFSDYSTKLLDLTLMDSNGKQKAKNTLNRLIASGWTNIYSSIKEGFNLIYSIDYTINDIFPTMILLSDGYVIRILFLILKIYF
jgi:Mg-chelatase subunit ChlD